MAFWVFGKQAGRPAPPLYLDDPSSEAARDQAHRMGFSVEAVVFTASRNGGSKAESSTPTKRGLFFASLVVWMFRALALVCGGLTTVVVLVKWEAVKAVDEVRLKLAAAIEPVTHALWGTLVVAVLLAVGETVRLFSQLEINTRMAESEPAESNESVRRAA